MDREQKPLNHLPLHLKKAVRWGASSALHLCGFMRLLYQLAPRDMNFTQIETNNGDNCSACRHSFEVHARSSPLGNFLASVSVFTLTSRSWVCIHSLETAWNLFINCFFLHIFLIVIFINTFFKKKIDSELFCRLIICFENLQLNLVWWYRNRKKNSCFWGKSLKTILSKKNFNTLGLSKICIGNIYWKKLVLSWYH